MSSISIRIKVFLLFFAAALLTVVPALVLIAGAVEDRVYQRAAGELEAADDALNVYWRNLDETLSEAARRLASEPRVIGQLLNSDTVALERTLEREVIQRLVAFAVDSTGASLVGPAFDSAAIQRGEHVGALVLFPRTPAAPIRLAMWPVTTDSGQFVGVVGVGRRLDAAIIEELGDLAGEAALIVADTVAATTLESDSIVQALGTMDLPTVMQRSEIRFRVAEQLPYGYVPASPFPTHPSQTATAGILLLRLVAEELQVAQGVSRYVVGVGIIALLFAVALAFVVARIVARPAQTLAAAAAELARGNFNAPLPGPSGDEVGQLTQAFGEMRSAIAEREARLRSAQAELIHREKLAAMGRLVAQLSHEINNPIYNIQNCLEVLDRRGDPDDPNREFLSLAREELERMAVLTRQLLDQSRPLSDATRLLDLNHLVTRVVTLAANEAAGNKVAVTLALDPDLPTVVAHPDAMQQVLANLVTNAIDAMPGGGTLSVQTRADETAIEVIIADTGGGIADEHLPHIFEAFYTTKPGVSGVGLGLFVSEGIVRGHRGQLRVESKLGAGTRFIMRLPRETLDPLPGDADEDLPAGMTRLANA